MMHTYIISISKKKLGDRRVGEVSLVAIEYSYNIVRVMTTFDGTKLRIPSELTMRDRACA